MCHGNFSDFGGVFADALQEVLELRHGGLFDLLPQLGDGFGHGLWKPMRHHAGEVGVFKLLQCLQCGVVPEQTHVWCYLLHLVLFNWSLQVRIFSMTLFARMRPVQIVSTFTKCCRWEISCTNLSCTSHFQKKIHKSERKLAHIKNIKNPVGKIYSCKWTLPSVMRLKNI